jgi:hypothetical protein
MCLTKHEAIIFDVNWTKIWIMFEADNHCLSWSAYFGIGSRK